MAVEIGKAIGFAASAFKAGVAPLFAKAARDLSEQEAFNLLMFLVDQGEISLDEPIKTDSKGMVISPKPGQQVKVKTSMAGVDFMHASSTIGGGPVGSAKATLDPSFRPTPAFAIVLLRMAVELSSSWGVTEIVWGGVGIGGNPAKPDCHSWGACMDFYGAKIGTRLLDVRRDWWSKKVYQKDGTVHTTKSKDPNAFDRWGDDADTYYRLAASKDPDNDVQIQNFFADVYEFITVQCTLGADVAADVFQSSFGALKNGTIMHPDYPFAGSDGPGGVPGRRTHNDHIHFQLGKAR